MTGPDVGVVKDEQMQHPIASAWRPTIIGIVESFARRDYLLSEPRIQHVGAIAAEKAKRIEEYIKQYGESLTTLPEKAWTTSASQWMGTHWDVLIDLFTLESGESDLVLHMRIFEDERGYLYEVDSVHVP